MPEKTTLLLILMAGSEDTTHQLDPLLKEVQEGLENLPVSARPEVYCFYQRLDLTGYQFPLVYNTFSFLPGGILDPVTPNFPPSGSTVCTGTLNDQVTAFVEWVNPQLVDQGPVHVVIGAHGIPALGFHPTLLLRMLFSLLLSPFNARLKDLTWRVRFKQLRDRFFRIGQPLGAIASGSKLPDLSLDATAVALTKLSRLNMLLLHACNLSSIETISALSGAQFHIACENSLSNFFKLSKWFSKLASSSATPKQITSACFSSMTNGSGNALGCFSSHPVASPTVLDKLNTLGKELSSLMTSAVAETSSAAEAAIKLAQSKSGVNNYTLDLVHFAELLVADAGVSLATHQACQAVILAIQSHQYGLIKTDEWKNKSPFTGYGGISAYLPQRKQQYYDPALLPEAFRKGAPEWFTFVELWGN